MKKSKNQYRSRGSALAIGAFLLVILVIIGIGFFAMSMYMGSQKEVKNAVDAGMLNVGKQVMDDLSVKMYPTPNELLYIDVANDETNGGSFFDAFKGVSGAKLPDFTMRRINRVWAKALQIGINAEAAEKAEHGGQGPSNARDAFDGAEAISNRLADKIAKVDVRYGYFNDLAKRNSVRMLGNEAKIAAVPGGNWQTSFMQRERESNVTVAPPEYTFPPEYPKPWPDLLTKSTRRQVPESGKDLWFLRGYAPIQLAGRTFWQIPFLYAETPHMVSSNDFDASNLKNKPFEEWKKPIPNSFSGEGLARDPSGKPAQKAMAWVLTNPDQPFKMSLPHSFVRIKLDDMFVQWYFFPIPPPIGKKFKFGDPVQYEYKEPTSAEGPRMPAGGAFCEYVQAGADVEVGWDVFLRSLDGVIFAAPGEGNVDIEKYLLNRANEMIGKVGKVITKEELHACLSDWKTIAYLAAGQTEFFLFTEDGEHLKVVPKDYALVEAFDAPWLLVIEDKDPDGTEMTIVDDVSKLGVIVNIATGEPDEECVFIVPPIGWGDWHKSVFWTPGSGFNGCLGTCRVKRWTEVKSLAVAIPAP